MVDCANGAAYRVAPTVLWELGAEVVPIGVAPDGFNINQGCGSTDAGAMLRARCVAHGADLGIALDGDADRLMMADENGELIDGDQLMALIAQLLAARTAGCKGGGVVATVMSNLGLERYLAGHGLAAARAPRWATAMWSSSMRADGYQRRRRAVRPHHPHRLRHHRRRPDRGAAGAGGDRRARASRRSEVCRAVHAVAAAAEERPLQRRPRRSTDASACSSAIAAGEAELGERRAAC